MYRCSIVLHYFDWENIFFFPLSREIHTSFFVLDMNHYYARSGVLRNYSLT